VKHGSEATRASADAGAKVVVLRSQATRQPLPVSVLDLVATRAGEPAGNAIARSVELEQQVEQLGYKRYWVARQRHVMRAMNANVKLRTSRQLPAETVPNVLLYVLMIDVGGTHIKVYPIDRRQHIKIDSGPAMTPKKMIQAVRTAVDGCRYDVVSLGYPGPVVHGKPLHNPVNLGPGWVGFDFRKAFCRPTQIINDAAMQALGGGRMLFLGLGTGLGSALIVDGVLEPMELAHLPYKNGKTFEAYIGDSALKRRGQKKWTKSVFDLVAKLKNALQADYVVLGGGNGRRLTTFPPHTFRGTNENAHNGGLRLWQPRGKRPQATTWRAN